MMFPPLVVNREPRLLYYATLESKPTAQNLSRYHVLNESQSEADDLAKFMNCNKKSVYMCIYIERERLCIVMSERPQIRQC